jgi:hypothetical protein
MMRLTTPLTQVDTTALYALGSRVQDKSCNEYIYLSGVASTVAGSAVTFTGAYATRLAIADMVGPVAFAMAATVASTYGWYQIAGLATGITLTAVTTQLPLYLTVTAGELDDAAVGGDIVHGAFSYSVGGVHGSATMLIYYPSVTNTVV